MKEYRLTDLGHFVEIEMPPGDTQLFINYSDSNYGFGNWAGLLLEF
jgi:hypothetical protein